MGRLNLTLDDDTLEAVTRDALRSGVPVATHARRLLRDAVAQRERIETRKLWASAYAEERADARNLLDDWEIGSLEVVGDEKD
jgi:hypothetical protein